MLGRLRIEPKEHPPIRNGKYSDLRESRIGVMLHYDASSSDKGAVAWFADPRCGVSYHYLVLDDGSYVSIAPIDKRAWHAGVCRPSGERLTYKDANSALIGIAIAATGSEQATAKQLLTVAWLTRKIFQDHGWKASEGWRVTGHEDEAWPRGRKADPTGPDGRKPALRKEDVRDILPLFE